MTADTATTPARRTTTLTGGTMGGDDHQQQPQWSIIVPNTDRAGVRGEIRRCYDATASPTLGLYGCRTVYEAFRHGESINPLGPCMGFRAISSNTGFATPYIYSSYHECLYRINSFAAGLDVLQLVSPNSQGLKVLGLYMKNCMEWVLAEQAAYTVGAATVPFYDTLGPETVEFILQQTELQTLVCTRAQLEALLPVYETASVPQFQTIILVDGMTQQTKDRVQQANQKAGKSPLRILSYAQVEAAGAQQLLTPEGHKHSPPNPDDVATFCYTSGTTGNPKGALLTHQNLISTLAGIAVHPEYQLEMYDRHFSYLPLAHIFERVVMLNVLIKGAAIAFFRGDTNLLIEDLKACRPTILPVAPRVLNKIYDKIMAGISQASGTTQWLFQTALRAKAQGLKHGRMKHMVYDTLLFNPIKKGLGMDHLRYMMSGSAPLGENVMIFFRCLLGIPVVEGYGQTEGAAAATIGHPEDQHTAGHVGGPTAATEICLYDVPEMGYLHTDTHHRNGMPCHGRGEICIRGPNVFKGYYMDPKKTKETVDEEGWLHSGDIGLWRLDGTLQIIDRKKNLFKLSQGEYVAPEKIENILIRSLLIAQCFVHGDSLQSSLVAIIVPEPETVKPWAMEQGILEKGGNTPSSWLKDLCQNPILKEAILQDIRKLSQESKLQGFEYVKAIHLTHEPFTLENGLLTPTFKVKRQQVRDKYEQEIANLYASLPPPKSKL